MLASSQVPLKACPGPKGVLVQLVRKVRRRETKGGKILPSRKSLCPRALLVPTDNHCELDHSVGGGFELPKTTGKMLSVTW